MPSALDKDGLYDWSGTVFLFNHEVLLCLLPFYRCEHVMTVLLGLQVRQARLDRALKRLKRLNNSSNSSNASKASNASNSRSLNTQAPGSEEVSLLLSLKEGACSRDMREKTSHGSSAADMLDQVRFSMGPFLCVM